MKWFWYGLFVASLSLAATRAPSSCADFLANMLEAKETLSLDAWHTLEALVAPTTQITSSTTLKKWAAIDLALKTYRGRNVIPEPVSASFTSAQRARVEENWKLTEKIIFKFIKEKESLSHENIKEINAHLTDQLPSGWEDTGSYRVMTDVDWGAGFFLKEDVPAAMDVLLTVLREADQTEHPLRLAAIAWQGILTVHPFSDGNGRTALMVANWILLKHGYPTLKLSSPVMIAMHRKKGTPSQAEIIDLVTKNISAQLKL